jgi:hypothetical protein
MDPAGHLKIGFSFMFILVLGGCGYRLAGGRLGQDDGRTIGVPTFVNSTTTYRVEQRLSEAVRRELVQRTRYSVSPEPSGDAVIMGEILSFSAIPIIFNEQGRASAYSIFVEVKVSMTDNSTGRIVFQNDRWVFRETFQLAQNSGEFVLEDTAATERLARRFAASLVASLLNTNP